MLAARLVSQAADGVFEAALAGYVLFSPERAAGAGTIAVGLAVVLLPFSIVGPFVGVILDRVDRRRTLRAAGVLRAVLALLAALVLTTSGGAEGGALVVLAIGTLACSRLVLSGVSAVLPLVVAGEDLVAAGGFATTSGTAATAVGAGLGAAVRALAGRSDRGLAVVALTAAVAYLAAALAAHHAPPGRWGPVHRARADDSSRRLSTDVARAARDVAAGVRQLWSQQPARDALLAVNGARFGYGVVFVSTLLLLRDRPGHSAGTLTGLGSVGAGLALGTCAGAVLGPRLARVTGRPNAVSIGLALGGATALLAAPVGDPVLIIAVSPLLGLGQQLAKVSSDALIQLEVDDANRGRAFTVVDVAFSVSYVGAAAIAAGVVPASGRAPVALGVAGAGWLLSAAVHARVVSRRPPAGRRATGRVCAG